MIAWSKSRDDQRVEIESDFAKKNLFQKSPITWRSCNVIKSRKLTFIKFFIRIEKYEKNIHTFIRWCENVPLNCSILIGNVPYYLNMENSVQRTDNGLSSPRCIVYTIHTQFKLSVISSGVHAILNQIRHFNDWIWVWISCQNVIKKLGTKVLSKSAVFGVHAISENELNLQKQGNTG